MKKNKIGLDPAKTMKLVEKLNILLANYQVFYINPRGFRWNINGDKFFELHLKFEELHNDALLMIDEVAERVLTLGQTPGHSFLAYLKAAKINEVIDGFSILISPERELLDFSADASDEGTNTLMSDYIRQQESWYRYIRPT